MSQQVSRLPPVLAVKFLTDIVAKLEARPNRGALLMVWIRAVLLVHASYLMTVPDLPKVSEHICLLLNT